MSLLKSFALVVDSYKACEPCPGVLFLEHEGKPGLDLVRVYVVKGMSHEVVEWLDGLVEVLPPEWEVGMSGCKFSEVWVESSRERVFRWSGS